MRLVTHKRSMCHHAYAGNVAGLCDIAGSRSNMLASAGRVRAGLPIDRNKTAGVGQASQVTLAYTIAASSIAQSGQLPSRSANPYASANARIVSMPTFI